MSGKLCKQRSAAWERGSELDKKKKTKTGKKKQVENTVKRSTWRRKKTECAGMHSLEGYREGTL